MLKDPKAAQIHSGCMTLQQQTLPAPIRQKVIWPWLNLGPVLDLG